MQDLSWNSMIFGDKKRFFFGILLDSSRFFGILWDPLGFSTDQFDFTKNFRWICLRFRRFLDLFRDFSGGLLGFFGILQDPLKSFGIFNWSVRLYEEFPKICLEIRRFLEVKRMKVNPIWNHAGSFFPAFNFQIFFGARWQSTAS